MGAVVWLVPVHEADGACLSAAEKAHCVRLGAPGLRMAARVAAKHAASALVPGGLSCLDVTVARAESGAPVLEGTGAIGPLPQVSMSHSTGWGAALAWVAQA